jgi:acyl carrier protein
MNRTEIYEKLNTIFKDVLDIDELELNSKTTAEDVENWDSLSHINLIVAIEKDFKISFTTREAKSFINVGEMVNLIFTKFN